MQLLYPAGLKISLEAPHVGSLMAAAIGVGEAPSSPPIPTAEALHSSPTLPTVKALGDSGPTGAVMAPRKAAKSSPVAKEVASLALEVEQLMADYPSIVNSSKKLPKPSIRSSTGLKCN